MPIQKYLNTPARAAGLERIGKLHKGLPKQKRTSADGKEYEVVGRDTDYFRVEFVEGYEHLAEDFAALYGSEPKALPFMLDADSALAALDFWYEEYDSHATLLHRCDGVTQAVAYNKGTGYFEHGLPCCVGACKCKQVARLGLIMPDFIQHTGVMGTITMETHSDQDIRTLIARLTTFQNLYGTLRGVPFILVRVPRETSAPKTTKEGKRTGERTKIVRAMIDVRVDPDYARNHIARMAANARAALPPAHAAPALPAVDAPQLPAPNWTADEKRWAGFLEWTRTYGCSPSDVMAALEVVTGLPMTHPSDFTGEREIAMGAVIARVCDYNADRVVKWNIKGTGVEAQKRIRHWACEVISMRQANQPALPETTPSSDE